MAALPNNDDGANDKGGLAPHKNHCPHASQAIDISLDEPFASKLQKISMNNGNNGNVTCSIDGCNEEECWLCLKCHKILCGRYGNQHMMLHCTETNVEHCMAMGIKDLSFWCYSCENYINHLSVEKVWSFYSVAHTARFGEPIPEGLYQKTTFRKKPTTTMEPIPSGSENEEEEEDKEDEKKEESSKPTSNNNQTVDIIDDLVSKLTLEVNEQNTGYKKTVLFYHEDCLKHKPGNNSSHVERPGRCSRPMEMLIDYGLLKDLIKVATRSNHERIKGTHSNNHVEIIIGNENSHGWYDGDTFIRTFIRAAKLAAGATIDLLAGMLQNKYDNGFALVRPPGHHCEHSKGL